MVWNYLNCAVEVWEWKSNFIPQFIVIVAVIIALYLTQTLWHIKRVLYIYICYIRAIWCQPFGDFPSFLSFSERSFKMSCCNRVVQSPIHYGWQQGWFYTCYTIAYKYLKRKLSQVIEWKGGATNYNNNGYIRLVFWVPMSSHGSLKFIMSWASPKMCCIWLAD